MIVACYHPSACMLHFDLVSLLFGASIPTSSNILVKMFLHFIIFGRLCSENETPTSDTQTLAQTSLYSVTLYMKYYSQIYCSPRAVGDGNQKLDRAIIGQRHIASDSAYHRLCNDQKRL